MTQYDAPVMLLFFNRPDVLKKTFSWVQEVKPKRLFLVQDGARLGRADDVKNIHACREIVSNITWDCDVKQNYAEENMGCDFREFTGIDWCFQFVDKLIILEDDCKPAVSFYSFCAQLLERYEDDTRVHMISGFNRCGTYHTPYDYVFAMSGAGWGWATWKRVWEQVKSICDWKFLENEETVNYYTSLFNKMDCEQYRNTFSDMQARSAYDRTEGHVTSWEILVGGAMVLNHSLCIIPAKNMVQYLGFTQNATHSAESADYAIKRVRKVLTQSAYEIDGELKHPPFVVRDRVAEQNDYDTFWKSSKLLDHAESVMLKIRHGRWDLVWQGFLRFIKKK